MAELFKKSESDTPPYLDRIDELEKVDIVRLKGLITRDMIPIMEARIQENRRAGSKIEKNIIADFSMVVDVDSATIAFHLIHLQEYWEKGFEIGFIQINDEFRTLLDIFKEKGNFKVFVSEEEAIKALN